MKHRESKNVAASVRQRLLNEARASDRPFNEVLQYFAIERFLFRLSESPHGERFILKGALMLTTWEGALTRPTKDIDLLGHVPNDPASLVDMVKEVCGQAVPSDGLVFDPASVTGERIAEEAEYEGVRVRFQGYLGTARLSMQIDVGFGDAVVPGPVMLQYPTILDLPAPQIRGYTRESVIAEKFHTMARRGLLNSRMGDFFDVWTLSRRFGFDGRILAAAVRETFARRDLEVAAHPVALTKDFAAVVEAIAAFLGPVAEALHDGREFEGRWKPSGPWSNA